MATPHETFELRTDELFDRAADVHVSRILRTARDAGLSQREAWRATVELCDTEDVQKSWANWEEVADQAELGLRLQVLADCEHVAPAVYDFLSFFFRASAPELYRYAALALGRHSWDHPPLIEDLRNYADARDVGVDETVVLDGKRSRRRVLLAATARYLHCPDSREVPEFPVVVETLDDLHERTVADVAVLTRCCRQLVVDGRTDGEFRSMCWALVESLHDVLDRGGSQRDFVRTWGRLLSALEDDDSSRAASVWRENVARFEKRRDETYSGLLATLWEVDAAIAVAAAPGCEFISGTEVDEIGGLFETPDFCWLGRIRYWQWWRRTSDQRTGAWSKTESPDTHIEPELAAFIGEVVEPVEAGGDSHRAMHRWIASRLESLESRRRWWSHSSSSRAILTFLLLDAVRFRTPPRETISRLFEEADISLPGLSTSRSAAEGLAGMPWSGFHDLLWHIYRLEGGPADFPVESESFTSIATGERLLGFIRAGQEVRDLDILVDALEHFLRLEMVSNPEFDPRLFLYRIAARKPHPSVFRQLHKRTRGRKYRTESGTPLDLPGMLDAIAEEIDGENPPAHGCDGEWFPELRRVRAGLEAIRELDDLRDALTRFADQLDPRIPDGTTHERGLVDLLARSLPEEGSILCDSTAREGSVSPESLSATIADHIRRLRESTEELFDETGPRLTDIHRSARNISGRLDDICDELAPCVAPRDLELLREMTARLRERCSAWTAVLERGLEVSSEHSESAAETPAGSIQTTFDQVGEAVSGVGTSAMRSRAFRIAYRWLERREVSTSGDAEHTDPAANSGVSSEIRRQMLAMAVSATRDLELDERWPELLTQRWEELVLEAMELQAEPHVVDLATRPEFSIPRTRARKSATMEQLEQWLADRYHFPALAKLMGDTASEETRRLSSTPAALLRLVSNFTHVWLALLVGAVMLLDFGDAWVELARQGDTSGIAITFGIGLGGTFLYLVADIVRKTRSPYDEMSAPGDLGRLIRVVSFLGVCFAYTVLVTGGLWYLFSGTELVLHGEGAVLHILVWTGFALFVGVFFGLLTESS